MPVFKALGMAGALVHHGGCGHAVDALRQSHPAGLARMEHLVEPRLDLADLQHAMGQVTRGGGAVVHIREED